MTKQFVEWTEGEINRGRKVVLFWVIGSFTVLTFLIWLSYMLPFIDKIDNEFYDYYLTFAGLAFSAIGFYTGTSPKTLTEFINKNVIHRTKPKITSNNIVSSSNSSPCAYAQAIKPTGDIDVGVSAFYACTKNKGQENV